MNNENNNVNIINDNQIEQKKLGGIQMFIFDLTRPITLLLLLIATVALIFLSQEMKKSYIAAIPLFSYIILLVVHVTQLVTISDEYRYLSRALTINIVLDFVFVFLTYFSYLWVDDIEAKATNKKSIDNSLDWFWKDV